MGDIGTDQKEFEFEPFSTPAPAEPSYPAQPVTVPQEEPVPA